MSSDGCRGTSGPPQRDVHDVMRPRLSRSMPARVDAAARLTRPRMCVVAACLVVAMAACGSATSTTATLPSTSPTRSATPKAEGEALPAGTVTVSLPPQTRNYVGAGRLAATPDAIWAAPGVFRIAPTATAPTLTISTPAADGVAADSDSVWISDFQGDVVRHFNAHTGALEALITLPPDSGPEGIALTPGAVWVGEHHGGRVDRIDPRSNRVVASVVLLESHFYGPQGIAFGLGSIWTGVTDAGGTVYRIDPATNKVTAKIDFTNTGVSPCGEIAVGRTAVWISACVGTDRIARIDPVTNAVAKVVDSGGSVAGVASDGDSAWFVSGGDPDSPANTPGFLVQLRADDSIAHRYSLGVNFTTGGAAFAFGAIWMSSFDQPVVLRVPDQPS